MSVRVTDLMLRDSFVGIRQIIRQRLVSELRAMVPEGRIRFSVVRQPHRTLEFTGLVGPRALGIAQRRRAARRLNGGYLDWFARREDRRD